MHTKRLILIGAVLVTALLAWWSASSWLSQTGRFSDWHRYVWPSVTTILFASVTGIALGLLKSRWDRIAIITSSWASFILFFPASIWYLSAFPVFFLFWMSASRRSQRELDERHIFRVRSVFGVSSKALLLGIFLMVSLGYYSLPTDGGVTPDSVAQSVQRSVDRVYDSSVFQDSMQGLSGSLNTQFRQDVARYISTTVVRWLTPLGPVLPPLLALGLFLVLWGFVGLIREPVLWLSSGFFLLMRRTGFISMKEEQVPKEVISL